MTKPLVNASTVARIAGNICGALLETSIKSGLALSPQTIASDAVEMARLIVAAVERTEPSAETKP